MAGLVRLGIGPFRVYTFDDATVSLPMYRGQASSFSLKVCFATNASLTWEIMQPISGPTIMREFLDKHCSCGNTNCLEAVASGSAAARQLASEGPDGKYARDVVALCRAGDPRAVRRVRLAGQRIGEVLASLVSFYNPSRNILGGALAVLRDDLLAGIRAEAYHRALPLATRQLVIETTASGYRAGVLGGAILGAHGALSPDRLSQWIRSGTPA